MEVNENNYFRGCIGAFVGGLISTLPWVLLYVYGGYMYSLLTIIIAIGSFFGYTLFKGKITKKVPLIIGIISFVCITLAMWIIIPLLISIKNYGDVSYFIKFYYNDSFVNAMIGDYFISLLYTFLGTAGIIVRLKQKVDNNETNITASALVKEPIHSAKKRNEIVKHFKKLKATNKDNLITKTEALDGIIDGENDFQILVSQKLIIDVNGKYYYNYFKSEKLPLIISLVIFFIAGVIIAVAVISINKTDSNKNIKTEKVEEINENSSDRLFFKSVIYKKLDYKEPENYVRDIFYDDGIEYVTYVDKNYDNNVGIMLSMESLKNNYSIEDYINIILDNLKSNSKAFDIESKKLNDNLFFAKFNDGTFEIYWYYLFDENDLVIVESYNYLDESKKSPNIDNDVRNLVLNIKFK